jgi:ADP-heptose:LPS heptosyltransferase
VTLPAVLRLAEAFPAASLDLVVDRPFAPLLQQLADNLEVWAWPPRRSPGFWWRRLRTARYDLVLDYLCSPRTAFWTALTGAPLRVGFDVRLRGWVYNVKVPRNDISGFPLTEFAGEAFLDPLRALGFAVPPWRPAAAQLPDAQALAESYRRWAERWRRQSAPRIGIVLSATWSAKAWPNDQACLLHDLLLQEGASPLFITGPGDERLEAELRQTLPAAEFTPPTNLLELADLLADLDLLIGTDCGARHLATCLRVPTITLFGPTDPRGWNPEDPRHVALRTSEPCSPCDLKECPVPGHPCLENLKADQVLTTVRNLWPRLPIWRREREGASSCE